MANSRGISETIWVPEEFVCQAIPDFELNGADTADRPNPTKSDLPEGVVFPNAYYRLFDRNSLAFPAEYQGRVIRCVVKCEALVSRFGALSADLRDAEVAFLTNKRQLQNLAESLIQNGKVSGTNELTIV